jgi:hypothetical protein
MDQEARNLTRAKHKTEKTGVVMKSYVKLKIEKCQNCPHYQEEKIYMADSFDNYFKYSCNKVGGKFIESLDTFEKTGRNTEVMSFEITYD